MKKTNFMTAVLLVVAVLLMVACTQTPPNENPTPSSSLGGALEDNTLFGDGASSSASSQPTGNSTAPSSSATAPSSGASQPATQPVTQPSTQATQPSSAPKDPAKMDYETFRAMTGAEQRAFQESFESIEAFFAWYNAAKEAYEKENPPIEIGGDGVVTLPTNPG